MPHTRISTLVAQQLPEFIREDHQTFAAFLEAYYAWMEESGNALDASSNLLTSIDIDTSLDAFISYFSNQFLVNVPQYLVANKAWLIAHAKECYTTRGTIASFKLLFRLFYGEDINIIFPKESLLIVSDGKWERKQYLRLNPSLWTLATGDGTTTQFRLIGTSNIVGSLDIYINGILQTTGYRISLNTPYLIFTVPPSLGSTIKIVYNPFNLINLFNTNQLVVTIQGTLSGATAISETAERLILNGIELFNLNVSRVVGSFSPSETISATYTYDTQQHLSLTLFGTLASLLESINVIDGGANYNIGDSVPITGGAPIIPATAVIDDIYTAFISNIKVLNGGCGFQAGETAYIISTPNVGLTMAVASVDTSGNVHPNSYPIVTDVLSLFENVIMSNSNYGFAPPGTDNASNTLLSALSSVIYGGSGPTGLGPITNVAILSSTASFETSPTIVVDAPVVTVTGNTASGNTAIANVSLGYFGILGRMNVISGGTNYTVGDEIVFTNIPGLGIGVGAAAEVTEIHAANSGIKRVTFQPTRVNGTVNVSLATANVVTGNGTSFTTQLFANDYIEINNESRYVSTITNDTSLIVNTAFTHTSTNRHLGVYNRYFIGGINYSMNALPTATVVSGNILASGANIICEGVISGGEKFQPQAPNVLPGQIKTIRVVNPGNGYVSTPLVDLTHIGNGKANAIAELLANIFVSQGHYLNQDGMVSSDRKLQGANTFYQEHSYVIESQISLARYKSILKSLIHPAGMELFAEYEYEREMDQTGNTTTISSIRHENANGNLLIYDSSGNGLLGTANNGVFLGQTGDTLDGDTSAFFDGSNNWITIPDSSLLSASANQFTIEFLMKIPSSIDIANTNIGVIIKGRDPWEYSIYKNTPLATSFQFIAWTPTGQGVYNNNMLVPTDGNWHHYVWTANGTYSITYLDSNLNDVHAKTANGMSDTIQPFEIGRGGDAGGIVEMHGYLDEVAFYQTSLSNTRVAIHYAALTSGNYKSIILSDSPKGYWRLGDPS